MTEKNYVITMTDGRTVTVQATTVRTDDAGALILTSEGDLVFGVRGWRSIQPEGVEIAWTPAPAPPESSWGRGEFTGRPFA
jgi:hypothetical protein